MSKRKVLFLAAVLCGVCFAVACLRAAVLAITFDEAATYMLYVRDLNCGSWLSWIVWMYRSASNNHLLNTSMVGLSCFLTGSEYNEFAIRAPSILACAIYLSVAWNMLRIRQISATVFVVLVANFYLVEYFALARGYAMACALVLLSLNFYLRWTAQEYRTTGSLNWCMFFLLLAAAANTIVLMLVPCVCGVALCRLWANKSLREYLRRSWGVVIANALFCLLLGGYHAWIFRPGAPVYYGKTNFWDAIVMSYSGMFFDASVMRWLIAAMVVTAVMIGVFYITRDRLKTGGLDLALMTVGWLITLVACSLLLGKGYPSADRNLIPFYPLMVLGLSQIVALPFQSAGDKWTATKRILGISVIAFVLIAFAAETNFRSTRDWPDDQLVRGRMLKDCTGGQKIHLGDSASWCEIFYLAKYSSAAPDQIVGRLDSTDIGYFLPTDIAGEIIAKYEADAQYGDPRSQEVAGLFFYYGRNGTVPDCTKAGKYLAMAAENGSKKAADILRNKKFQLLKIFESDMGLIDKLKNLIGR